MIDGTGRFDAEGTRHETTTAEKESNGKKVVLTLVTPDSILSAVLQVVGYRRVECMVLISVISRCRQTGVA
jgi:hypothetical protein